MARGRKRTNSYYEMELIGSNESKLLTKMKKRKTESYHGRII